MPETTEEQGVQGLPNKNTSNSHKTYLCEYRFDGEIWGFDIQARSYEEAEARIRQMATGKVLGTLEGSIPVSRRSMAIEFFSNLATGIIN